MPKPRRRAQPEGYTKYWGIDPGKNGGIAIICNNRVYAYPIPDTDLDLWRIFEAHKSGDNRAVIEYVRSSPQMGVTSAFTFGRNFGKWEGFLTAALIPFEDIRPQVWQKGLHLTPRKKHTKSRMVKCKKGKNKGNMVEQKYGGETDTMFKKRVKAKAQQIFPDLPQWKVPKSEGKQLAICDALLIAEFCKRTAR